MPSSPARFRPARWLLFGLGILVMLIAMFYTAENWRGQRVWERCRRQLEAQGQVLDWSAYIPAPVPDDQNVFKAAWMEDWFVRTPHAPIAPGPLAPPLGIGHNTPQTLDPPPARILLAEIEIIPAPEPAAPSVSSSINPTIHSSTLPSAPPLTLRLDDPALPAVLLPLLLTNYAFGPAACTLVARAPSELAPLHLTFLAASTNPSATPQAAVPSTATPTIHHPPSILPSPSPQFSLTNLLLSVPAANRLRLESTTSNTFRVYLTPDTTTILAADYLAWSDQFNADFENMRQALARPYARIGGDYERPAEMPIINFVRVREVAQTLAQRAQCHLLLGQPDAALQDLALLHDLARMMDTQPALLVSAMIEAALTGLHASVVADGLRLHAWREPQLAALQSQLADTRLLTALHHALQAETAASSRVLERASSAKLADLYTSTPSNPSTFDRLKSGNLPLLLAPRGWTYQNRANRALAQKAVLDCLDPARQLLRPQALEAVHRRLLPQGRTFSPYTYLVAITLPNSLKATQTTARNQTQANEAFLACALERYRLAHAHYPETLEALIPAFAESLPHDLIGGAPLHYRLTPSGFLLYSVGWDEKDDGGQRTNSLTGADWPWP